MLAAAVAGFLLIRHHGRHLVAPAASVLAAPSAVIQQRSETLLHILLALAVVIIAARLSGALFARLRQPPVVGEVIAGILLGPSLLGRLWPEGQAFLLPSSIAPTLAIISQIGVIVYMFLVGMDLDTGALRRRGSAAVAISHASIIAPFLLGAWLAAFLYPITSTRDVPFTVFALFMGVAMSVTAFPVLARILTDQGLSRTRLGVLAITAAAVDDVTAWCLLAFVVGAAQSQLGGAMWTVGLAALYLALLLLAGSPVLRRFAARVERRGRVSREQVAAIFVGLLVSALVTEVIGIHALFGAFIFGALVPSDSLLARELRTRVEDLVTVLLLPAFFAFTGLRTRVDLVSDSSSWLIVALIIAVASAGKFGGSFLAARATGIDWRSAAALGVLMNTRGLMELIVLNVGLDLHVISPTLFAMMVIMALATTLATTPVLHWTGIRDVEGARSEGGESPVSS